MTCTICDMEFTSKTAKQKYCSRKCATEAVHRRNVKHVPGERCCEHCGTTYTPGIGRSNRGSGGKRFCSWKCKHAGQRGVNGPNFNGGRHRNRAGYVYIITPNRQLGDPLYTLEHRSVMEQHLGRPLLAYETIHHVNGVKDDNRIENLELWVTRQPKGQREADMVAWAQNFLTSRGYTVGR